MKKIGVSEVKATLLSNPYVNKWPEMIRIIQSGSDREGFASWDYVTWATTLVGGKEKDSLHGIIANFCLLQSIHLVDDLLDEDPKGLYHEVGVGTAANMALAFQALGNTYILKSQLSPELKSLATNHLQQMMLETAHGQNEDIQLDGSEKNYWRVVAIKTPPLFSSALYIGTLLGGGSPTEANQISGLGIFLGKLIQVNDDLHDLLQVEDSPDWNQPNTNIALLYCLHATYPKKADFLRLLSYKRNKEIILQLQQILVSSGAVSYCLYKMTEIYREALEYIQTLPKPYQKEAIHLLKPYMDKIVDLLTGVGLQVDYDELITTP